jgi:hypothetical protein
MLKDMPQKGFESYLRAGEKSENTIKKYGKLV